MPRGKSCGILVPVIDMKDNACGGSLTLRAALVCAALSGRSMLCGPMGTGEASLIRCLEAMGAEFVLEEDTAACLRPITTEGAFAAEPADGELLCLLLPLASLRRGGFFAGAYELSARETDLLRRCGVLLTTTPAGLVVSGTLAPGAYEASGIRPALLAGLMLALPLAGDSAVTVTGDGLCAAAGEIAALMRLRGADAQWDGVCCRIGRGRYVGRDQTFYHGGEA